jgi:hypothetical protein
MPTNRPVTGRSGILCVIGMFQQLFASVTASEPFRVKAWGNAVFMTQLQIEGRERGLTSCLGQDLLVDLSPISAEVKSKRRGLRRGGTGVACESEDLKLKTLVKRQRAVSNSLGPHMATESALSYLPCASISCQMIESYNNRRPDCIPSGRKHEPQTSYRLGEPSWQKTEKYGMWL